MWSFWNITYNTWAKEFWTGGNDFSAVCAIPVLQWPAAFHTIGLNGSWTRPFYPLQNEFCLLKYSALSRTSPGEGCTRTACLCVAVCRGKCLLKLHYHQQDPSMARGFMAPSVSRDLANVFFFSFLLKVGIHSTSLPKQVPPLSTCSPKRWIHKCDAAVVNHSHCLVCSKTWGKGWGAGLQTCWGWRVTGWASALLRRVISSSASSAGAGKTALHWPRYMSTKRRESTRQPCDKGMMEVRTVRWYLCCA